MDLNEHPTVKQMRARVTGENDTAKVRPRLQADWLRQLAINCGADENQRVRLFDLKDSLKPDRPEELRGTQ